MASITESFLLRQFRKAAGSIASDKQKQYAIESLRQEEENHCFSKRYDIFLSHAFADAEIIVGLRDVLVEQGFSVYVDWIEDSDPPPEVIPGFKL